MTVYQELQLNQAGSKNLIRSCTDKKEKTRHLLIYFLKIAITMVFCFFFVAGFSIIFGNENSVAGVVVLLCIMVFKNANFEVNMKDSIGLLIVLFAVMGWGSHLANQFGVLGGLAINLICFVIMMLFACHNPIMSNQSTIVLGYLLLYGYDVDGHSFTMRMLGLAVGCILTMIVFYRNHRHKTHGTLKEVVSKFHLNRVESRWQLCMILCVPIVLAISEFFHMPRAMWAGIAAMSVTVPAMEKMKERSWQRIVGNICGGLVFLALYYTLPPALYSNIGIIGGIGVGLSVVYGWQAIFNTFGALAIAAAAFGLKEAIEVRVIQNIYGVIFAVIFSILFYKIVGMIQERKMKTA